MNLPRTRLAALPTPLVRARGLESALGAGPLFIKRDDLTGFGIAGNKARALEFLVGAARAEEADVLVVAGSQSSNFCAGAAMAAATVGLRCHVLFAGAESRPATTNAALARAANARVHFLPGIERESLDEAATRHADELRARGCRTYVVPRGGATAVGALGYANAARELAGQVAAAGLTAVTVVLASGSGCTQAGLVAGRAADDLSWRVVGASVSRPPAPLRERVLSLAREAAGLLSSTPPEPEDVELRDHRGPGFGLPSERDRASASLALRREGLILDHYYGSKALTLLRCLLVEGTPLPVVFLHTGGLASALSSLGEGASS